MGKPNLAGELESAGELEPLVRQLVSQSAGASSPGELAYRRALAAAYQKGRVRTMRDVAELVNRALQDAIGRLL
ncbi:MAG: hypothetical protein OEO20_11415 [Gemmatimonadota bacterium]|nr:hypothetical protein [Gemmatimonadota bacterium]MDH3366513.1 hypothetical protein [Gemmatimonadota bacterium]MDH3478902.1 hypothetical protein [Gemmatimonadota bacterium]MDH3571819.1 hypothetical protein [Gemmatimonadota bacterium]